jgi:hypothetical protein
MSLNSSIIDEAFAEHPEAPLIWFSRTCRRTALPERLSMSAHPARCADEFDAAFDDLDKALAGGYRDAGELRNSKWMEPLRKYARFEPLLKKHGVGQ